MTHILEQEPLRGLLCAVQALALKKRLRLYLVGGMVRDTLAGRCKRDPDIDFALSSGAIIFARHAARQLKAGFVVLDEKHGTGRVVRRCGDRTVTLDFSDFKGRDIEEDLGNRDFTVNSLAVPLERVAAGEALAKHIIDPLGGCADLRVKQVRMDYLRVFDDDPLRLLRAFSTAALLNARIEPATLRLAAEKRGLLAKVSGERIRDELFKILSAVRSASFVELLDRQGLLTVIFPEIAPMKRMNQGAYHHLDVWGHTLETLARLEHARVHLRRLEQVEQYLDAELSSGRTRWQLLKLAAILHDIGKPACYRKEKDKVTFYGHDHRGAFISSGICRRLRLSNEEERALRRIVAMHLRPGFLATVPKATPRALFRFFRDAGEEAASILILSLADLRATRGYKLVEESRRRHERMVKRLLREFFQRKECPPPPRLVTGSDLIALGLEPSPLFGKILRELEELQAEGTIATKEQGLERAWRMAVPGRQRPGAGKKTVGPFRRAV